MPGLNIKRSNMTKSVQMNYKGGPKFFKIGWKYQDCDTPDTPGHLVCSYLFIDVVYH